MPKRGECKAPIPASFGWLESVKDMREDGGRRCGAWLPLASRLAHGGVIDCEHYVGFERGTPTLVYEDSVGGDEMTEWFNFCPRCGVSLIQGKPQDVGQKQQDAANPVPVPLQHPCG